MGSTRITIVQLEEGAADPHENLRQMEREIRANAASDLIVFPELAVHGHEWVEEHGSPIQALRGVGEGDTLALDRTIAECGTSVVYGKLLYLADQLHNLATFSNGRDHVSYAKTHVHWSERFTPGATFPIARQWKAPLGMLICFDAAFPEVPRLLALQGAEVIVNISAIPASFDLKHVHRRLVACSVQNQVYTIFANRAGEGFRGGSAVVDPRGDVVALAGERGTLTVDIDLDEVRRWREEEPIFVHRRPEIYGDLAR